jgi:hypothetical protein
MVLGGGQFLMSEVPLYSCARSVLSARAPGNYFLFVHEKRACFSCTRKMRETRKSQPHVDELPAPKPSAKLVGGVPINRCVKRL